MTDYKEPWDITTEDGAIRFASAIYSRLVGGEQDESELLWLAEYLRVNSTALAQPEPEGPGPADYRRWHEAHSEDCNTWSEQPTAPLTLRTTVEALAWANHCLARFGRPAIEPVPVSERLPKADDCDAEGYIWLWNGHWSRLKAEAVSLKSWAGAVWLPHHALPLPTPKGCKTGTHPV